MYYRNIKLILLIISALAMITTKAVYAQTTCTCDEANFEVVHNEDPGSDCGQASMCHSMLEYLYDGKTSVTDGEELDASEWGCIMKAYCPGAKSLARISGTVFLPDGKSIVSGAYIEAVNQDSLQPGSEDASRTGMTDENGNYSLNVTIGTWEILAYPADGMTDYEVSQTETVLIESLNENKTRNLTLRQKNVSGRVIFPEDPVEPIMGVADAYVYAYTEDWSDTAEASADADGYFSLLLDTPGTWYLEAYPPKEYESSYGPSEPGKVSIASALQSISAGNLSLRPLNVRGQVIFPDGTEAGYAYVEASAPDYSRTVSTEADEYGYFGLAMDIGKWNIYAEPPYEYEDWWSHSQVMSVEITSSDDFKALYDDPLMLRPKSTISGIVKLPDYTHVPGAPVYAENGFDFAYTETDADGYFTLSDLTDGTWYVTAMPPKGNTYAAYSRSDDATVEISPENNTVTIDYLLLKISYKTISGTVTYNGKGVPDAEIEAVNWEDYDFRYTATDENGRFEMKVEGGTWEVSVLQSEGTEWVSPGPQEISFARDDTEESDDTAHFILSAPDGYLTGRVTTPQGGPLTSEGDSNPSAMVHMFNTDTEFYRSVPLKSDGSFSVPLASGNYEVGLWLDPDVYPEYGVPDYLFVHLETGTKKADDIQVLERNATIKGKVTDKSGKALSSIVVGAWQSDMNSFHAETNRNGEYAIKVSPGTYVVEPWIDDAFSFDSNDRRLLFTEDPRDLEIKANDSKEVSIFQLERVAGQIKGTVKDESGNVLTDVSAWAYARQESTTDDARTLNETWVENGEFTLLVPAGKMRVGLYLDPRSGYSLVGEQSVQVSQILREMRAGHNSLTTAQEAIAEMYPFEQSVDPGAPNKREDGYSVTITLRKNSSVIEGVMKDADGNIVNVSGYVFADSARAGTSEDENLSGAWQWAEITDGSFSLPVSRGKWNLSYELDTDAYMPHPPAPIQVEVGDGTVNQDLPLIPLGERVRGRVEYEDGEPASDVQIMLRLSPEGSSSDNIFETEVFTDAEGKFNIPVPSGDTIKGLKKRGCLRIDVNAYLTCISTAMNWCGGTNNYCYKEAKVECRTEYLSGIRSSSKEDEEMVLVLRKADVYLTGKVLAGDGETGVEGAFVSAYSADGQKADGYTDSSGEYQLQAARASEAYGNIWTVRAAYKPAGAAAYYLTEKTTADISGTDTNISVSDLVLSKGGTLPGQVTRTFNAEKSWNFTLSDGFQIQLSANSVPVGKDERNVKITVEPTVYLSQTLEDEAISYGYAITAREKSSTKELLEKFNQNALLVFRYTDERLTNMGLTEADIRPAYFSSITKSWQPVKSFTLDTDANKITCQTDHFSTWALITSKSVSTGEAETGDINNDGSVNLKDAILAMKVCAGSASFAYKEADVNGDGKIGMNEAIYILKKLVQPDA
jgi:hypothetical protein